MNHCSFIEIVFVRNKIRAGFSSAIIYYYYIYLYHTGALIVGPESFFVFCFLFFCGHVKVDKTAHNNIIVRRHNNNKSFSIFSATLPTRCRLSVFLPEPINNLFSITLLLCDLTFSYVPPPPHASQNRRRLVYFNT